MKTLVLIGYFVSGMAFSQEMPADVCHRVEDALARNGTVTAETEIGTFETIKTAVCVDPDEQEILS